MPSTLVVEDDPAIAEVVGYQLRKSGHEVTVVHDGTDALREVRSGQYGLIVLDIMLPGMSGIDVLRVLRRESEVPVIVLSARDADADQVMALELGADDYVTKPFSVRQLLARVQAVTRRSAPAAVPPPADVASYALVIDEARHEVRRHGEVIPMPPKVFEVLCFLARHANRACSRQEVLDAVWGDAYEGQARTLDVHVHWLRQRVEDDPANPRFVRTVRQYGYRFTPTPEECEERAVFITTPVVTRQPLVSRDVITRGPRPSVPV